MFRGGGGEGPRKEGVVEEGCVNFLPGTGQSEDVVAAGRIGVSSQTQSRDSGVRWVYGRCYLSGFIFS